METKLVNYKLPVDLIAQIEEMSEGNKTSLVIDLLKQALAVRRLCITDRDFMYSALMSNNRETNSDNVTCPKYGRRIITGLWL